MSDDRTPRAVGTLVTVLCALSMLTIGITPLAGADDPDQIRDPTWEEREADEQQAEPITLNVDDVPPAMDLPENVELVKEASPASDGQEGAGGGPGAPSTPVTASCADRDPHPPIRITEHKGPEGFTIENPITGETMYRPGSGVVDGTGTADDPYVIAGWCIPTTPTQPPVVNVEIAEELRRGILIANTSAHVVIEDVVTDQGLTLASETAREIPLFGSLVASAIENEIEGSIGIHVDHAQNVTVQDAIVSNHLQTDVGHGGVGLLAEGSDEILIENTTSQANEGVGIAVTDTHEPVLRENTASSNGGVGIAVVDAPGPLIRGNTLDTNGAEGVWMMRSDRALVETNLATGNDGDGVETRESSDVVVQRNEFAANLDGVSVVGGENGTIRANTVTNGREDGFTTAGDGHVVENNTVNGALAGGVVVFGQDNQALDNQVTEIGSFGLASGGGQNLISGNNISNGDYLGIAVVGDESRAVGNHVTNTTWTGITIGEGNRNVIEGNTVMDIDDHGVEIFSGLAPARHNVVRDNTISGVDHHSGIDLFSLAFTGAANSTIENNTVTDSWNGIWASPAWDSVIENNTVQANLNQGITVLFGEDSRVQNNLALENRWGISVARNLNATVEANTVQNNDELGIRIAGGDKIFVEDNDVQGSIYGLYLGRAHGFPVERITVSGNNMHGNDLGLGAVDLPGTVNATNNWWNASTGPSSQVGQTVTDACTGETADGDGQTIRLRDAEICFDPWLSGPNTDAGAK